MTDKQLNIYKGLKSIGPEIAQFYIDGLAIIDSNLGTKSNLLAHTLREIDGGLRDIFEQEQLKKDIQKNLQSEDLERIFQQFNEYYKDFDYLRDLTFNEFKEAKGHISSILVSFGFSIDHPLSMQYIKAVRWLAKYAHRSGAYNEPRNPKDIINLWNEFEDVLSKLLGNYYALTDRVDSLLRHEEPSSRILKTLPNLLNTPAIISYFFNNLKSYKWLVHLEKEGYFDGSKNPEPIELVNNPNHYSIPYWAALSYLENITENSPNSSEKDTYESIIKIIDNISNFRNKNGQRIENYHTDYAVFKIICHLPEQYLNERHFLFIYNALKSKWHGLIGSNYDKFIDRLFTIGNNTLLLKGIDLLLMYKFHDGPFYKVDSIFTNYELERTLSECKCKIILTLGLKLQKLTFARMKEVINLDESLFNIISIQTIEDHEQSFACDRYDYQLVRLLRDILENLEAKDITKIIKELLNEQHSIFKRLAIHIIRIRYSELQELLWSLEENPLNMSFKHELYELFLEHSINFDNEKIKQTIDWINTKDYYINEDIKEDKDIIAKSIAYQKKEWLTSLLPSNSENVNKLIAEMNAISDIEIEHPGFDSWHSTLIGTISPLTNEELQELSINELISYYTNFNKKEYSFIGPSVEGLIDQFTLIVRYNPEKYNTNCNQFIDAPPAILYAWIRGLEESWRNDKKEFKYNEIINAVFKILEKETFWDSYNSNGEYNKWFVSNFLLFIEGGIRDGNQAFEVKSLPIIKNILFIILAKDSNDIYDYQDLSMTVLNNTKGKVYKIIFQYSLRLACIENKKNERWDNQIKEFITTEIQKDENNPLLFYIIGQFLPDINYLDKNWMNEDLCRLFPIVSEINWLAIMNGYFYYHRQPNKNYLKLFTLENHLQKALSLDLLEKQSVNNMVRQICTAYLYSFEGINLKGEIIQILIKSKSKKIISNLIYFFWSPNFPFESKVVNKIKLFWKEIYNHAIKLENKEIDKEILSGSCKWLNSIDIIDGKIYEILLNSIKYVTQSDRYYVIEALSNHIYNSPKEVGLILLELFKIEVTYDISRGKLQEIVQILYKDDFKEIADQICILHGEKGFNFLRDLYNKFNN
ncbi:hypothetical protein REB14_00405 [Chryseobacterium sp. ES2]|uniref:ATP-binding protein n=1 Tax=Chryseobacterium metallicongregator TaxID=3073042 RepID=A0ABU1DYL7_9FLAO|nr:hypothetical protein [Chryseobacterium sp. ES2]MDR4950637.1 hypothetical protein [Chryseobacterium sp. ES2]